jgi:hypothetical protein
MMVPDVEKLEAFDEASRYLLVAVPQVEHSAVEMEIEEGRALKVVERVAAAVGHDDGKTRPHEGIDAIGHPVRGSLPQHVGLCGPTVGARLS